MPSIPKLITLRGKGDRVGESGEEKDASHVLVGQAILLIVRWEPEIWNARLALPNTLFSA